MCTNHHAMHARTTGKHPQVLQAALGYGESRFYALSSQTHVLAVHPAGVIVHSGHWGNLLLESWSAQMA